MKLQKKVFFLKKELKTFADALAVPTPVLGQFEFPFWRELAESGCFGLTPPKNTDDR
jgi:hypothetical protein